MGATSRGGSLGVLLGGLAWLATAPAQAAGFAVAVQTASALGTANAGVTAAAEDAGTAWFNPAGMARFQRSEIAQAVHFDLPSLQFDDHGSQPALGQRLGDNGGDAGRFAVIPPLFAIGHLDERVNVGLTINVPFGQKTKYDGGWMGRFQSLESEVKTISVSPAMSFRVDDHWWLGAGLSVQWVKATLTNDINYSAIVADRALASGRLTPQQVAALLDPARPDTIAGLTGETEVEGDDLRVGWNIGVIYNLDDRLRLGAQFRSRIRYRLEGHASFQPPTSANPLANAIITAASAPGAPLSNTDLSASIELPPSASVGVWWQATPALALLFDAQWTGWSSFDEVSFIRGNGSTLATVVYDWRDTWRFAAGATYRISDAWQIRGGIAYDQTVIRNDAERGARLPDAAKLWLTMGARYDWKPGDTWFDVALSYVDSRDAGIHQNNGSTAAYGLLDGTYQSHVFIVSLQATKRF